MSCYVTIATHPSILAAHDERVKTNVAAPHLKKSGQSEKSYLPLGSFPGKVWE